MYYIEQNSINYLDPHENNFLDSFERSPPSQSISVLELGTINKHSAKKDRLSLVSPLLNVFQSLMMYIYLIPR